jgi:hypothetical protein
MVEAPGLANYYSLLHVRHEVKDPTVLRPCQEEAERAQAFPVDHCRVHHLQVAGRGCDLKRDGTDGLSPAGVEDLPGLPGLEASQALELEA